METFSPRPDSILLTLIPSGRIGEPEDIGRAAAGLASYASDSMNGLSINIAGGGWVGPAPPAR
ncbi:MAG: hypothetical protein ACXW4N_10980 [Candidatus Deferrimicrobiaceae bacterium]